MVSIVMEDDCLAPETYIVIKYNGRNPFAAYCNLKKFLREIWEVEAKDYWEREFRWDNSEDPHGFFVKAYVVKGLDRFTKVIIEVVMQGVQPSDQTKPGSVEIKIGGVLRTEFGGGNVLEDARNPFFRAITWFYVRYFYWKQRRFYLREWCYNRIQRLKRAFQELLNITPGT